MEDAFADRDVELGDRAREHPLDLRSLGLGSPAGFLTTLRTRVTTERLRVRRLSLWAARFLACFVFAMWEKGPFLSSYRASPPRVLSRWRALLASSEPGNWLTT